MSLLCISPFPVSLFCLGFIGLGRHHGGHFVFGVSCCAVDMMWKIVTVKNICHIFVLSYFLSLSGKEVIKGPTYVRTNDVSDSVFLFRNWAVDMVPTLDVQPPPPRTPLLY